MHAYKHFSATQRRQSYYNYPPTLTHTPTHKYRHKFMLASVSKLLECMHTSHLYFSTVSRAGGKRENLHLAVLMLPPPLCAGAVIATRFCVFYFRLLLLLLLEFSRHVPFAVFVCWVERSCCCRCCCCWLTFPALLLLLTAFLFLLLLFIIENHFSTSQTTLWVLKLPTVVLTF